jgi:hypothetical protein
MRGKTIVEQIDKTGEIVMDYDTSVSVKEIYNRIKTYFPNINEDEDGMIFGEFNGKEYSIRAKNITYLGNPHPVYKKRIQIPTDLQKFYRKSKERNRKPILLGVYTYHDNFMFCDFNIDDFVNKKAHNSSAHVYSSDIMAAVKDKIFQKEDYFGNKITVFHPQVVNIFLEDLFSERESLIQEFVSNVKSEQYDLLPNDVLYQIEKFFEEEKKQWHGRDCYEEMIEHDYRNKFQPEWAGFFLEYQFEKYINKNNITNLITYAQDKKEGGVDLDLYFPVIKQYGDLKAHSDNSRGIQGNDWGTIFNLLKKGQHIYYIVCEHSTIKDSECNYEVTKFWNRMQKKNNLMSYSKRMKNTIVLKKVYVLDINNSNKQYLTMFKQGVNSNGKLREPKIMIEDKNLEHFIIKEINL